MKYVGWQLRTYVLIRKMCLIYFLWFPEDADDLRREGVRNIPKSGYKLSKV
jgi:hypothetical protein